MTAIDIRQTSETKDLHKFLLLKTEKLSVAIHILTGHLSPAEPLRNDIRRSALKLASDAQILLEDDGENMSDTQHLARGVDATLSLVYMIKGSRLVSPANAHILEREYLELKNYFSKSSLHSEPTNKAVPYIGHDKGQTGHPQIIATKKPAQAHDDKKSTEGLSRKEIILNIIEGKNSYSLGEIAVRIKGVSEKTIQRDLLSLVASKVLKKIGERRWSRYARV